jgi:iron(III) transport system ATP-binding protein
MNKLKIDGFCKEFNGSLVVDNVNITVKDGEFLTLLGPSGCGKSTTLFAIAGLDKPTSGRISLGETTFFDDKTDTFVEPENRNCGLVFQSYALWPHMTVWQNLAFPLDIRKTPKAEKERRINEAIELVELNGLEKRYPHELSGGQQQRVSLARTLVYEPKLLLLDEPLSNLDAKLRIRARKWLKELQTRLKLTTVYVTHDQAEALSLSDRIAIMDKGKLVQLDTPANIYKKPANAFVADFIGNSNFIPGKVVKVDSGRCEIDIGHTIVNSTINIQINIGDKVVVAVRPECVLPTSENPSNTVNVLEGKIVSREYLGSKFQYFIELKNGESLRMESELDVGVGEIQVTFDELDAITFSA